jgi:hypothetical protein
MLSMLLLAFAIPLVALIWVVAIRVLQHLSVTHSDADTFGNPPRVGQPSLSDGPARASDGLQTVAHPGRGGDYSSPSTASGHVDSSTSAGFCGGSFTSFGSDGGSFSSCGGGDGGC